MDVCDAMAYVCLRMAGFMYPDRGGDMAFRLDEIVPWGRSFTDYQRMFTLSTADVNGHILGCGDGPASFNAELTSADGSVISLDPLYSFSADEIRARIDDVFETVVEATRRNQEQFVWGPTIADTDDLRHARGDAMRRFLADFDAGVADGRYIEGALPTLPFDDRSFDLALCSHLLFLYSEQLGFAFHVASLVELCRVAAEVRVFPLVELEGGPSRHLHAVVDALAREAIDAAVESVDYEFQRGGNQMLRLRRRAVDALECDRAVSS